MTSVVLLPSDLLDAARQLAAPLMAHGALVATAESCTGGLIAATLTELAGSSQWFERGFVTYSNASKHELLGVPADTLEAHGAVSEPVARAMAEGGRTRRRQRGETRRDRVFRMGDWVWRPGARSGTTGRR